MRGRRLASAFVGVVFLSCGGGGGRTGTGGSGAGTGGTTGAGGESTGTGGQATATNDGGASCAASAPCGGDIVGTWKVTQSCVTETRDISNLGSACTGASVVYHFSYSGTLTYKGDGTFDSTIMGNAAVHEHYPSGCNPFGETCAQLAHAAADAGLATTCSTDATGGCGCDGVTPLTAASSAGTYSAAGTSLSITWQDGGAAINSYCVQGGVLHEIPGAGDGGPSPSGEVVFVRQ